MEGRFETGLVAVRVRNVKVCKGSKSAVFHHLLIEMVDVLCRGHLARSAYVAENASIL